MQEIEVLDEPTVDSGSASPRGTPCEACGCPVEPQDKFCPACGTPHVVEAAVVTADAKVRDAETRDAETRDVETGDVETGDVETGDLETGDTAETEHRFFRCDNCGAEVSTDPDQRSYHCPFCDSTYVVEYSPDKTGRQGPEFVIGFAVTPEQAKEKFHTWLNESSLFRPGDLKTALVAEKQKGVYLPFWSFSMLAQSRWSASIGEYWYRTETYTTRDSKGNTVTKTRQVRETEWWPLAGNHHRYYSGFLVSGSRGLPQNDAEMIKPFNLPALKRYEPSFVAGWLAEEYSVQADNALDVCKRFFHSREQQNVATFLPGDTHRNLEVSTGFSDVNSDLCLLPVYVLSYNYRDKIYRFLVNGQTGKYAGYKPLSWKRIAAFVFFVLLLILVVVLAAIVISQNV